MSASGLDHTTETMKPVAHDSAARMEVPPGERGNRLAGETRDAAELNADRLAFGCRFDGGDEGGLPRRPAPAFPAGPLATHISVVDLDPTGQLFGRVPFHHVLFELVFERPGRALSHTEASAEFDAGDPLIGLGHVIDGAQPRSQRQFGRGEDRPGDRRGLPATGGTLKQVAGLHHTVLAPAALGTDEPVRPSARDHQGPALLLGAKLALKFGLAEPLLELDRVARHHYSPSNRRCPWFVPNLRRLREVGNQESLLKLHDESTLRERIRGSLIDWATEVMLPSGLAPSAHH